MYLKSELKALLLDGRSAAQCAALEEEFASSGAPARSDLDRTA